MNAKMGTPVVPISWGELIDKITILEIKDLKIDSITANKNIRKELKHLLDIANLNNMPENIKSLKTELKNVNLRLWDVEDSIREKELASEFDKAFIELARSVYRLNDVRAKTKQSINLILQSELVEEKSDKDFQVEGNLGLVREKELAGEFDKVFIELARSVYRLNDVRAKIKQSINSILRSELVEEKSYKDFSIAG